MGKDRRPSLLGGLLKRIETQLGHEYNTQERVDEELERMTVKRLLEMLEYMHDE